MNPIYTNEAVSGSVNTTGPNEAGTWYTTENNYSTNGSTFSSLGSFNTVLLETDGETGEVILQQQVDSEMNDVGWTFSQEEVKPKPSSSKVYSCDLCPSTFNNSSNLKSHLRTHTGERPYRCNQCSAAFVQSSNLKSHMRTHTGERPFTCDECGQSFSRSSHLTGHKRTHTGEKPYICGICSFGFTTSTHLRNHMRKHTGEKPYSCNLCDMTFNQSGSLNAHLLLHTGERPYRCSKCGGAFRSKRDLVSHERLHSLSKPYKCVTCSKSFKTNQYLQKHIKKCGMPVLCKKRGRPRSVIKINDPDDSSPDSSEESVSKITTIGIREVIDKDDIHQEYFQEF